jgi:hypothetical protein
MELCFDNKLCYAYGSIANSLGSSKPKSAWAKTDSQEWPRKAVIRQFDEILWRARHLQDLKETTI